MKQREIEKKLEYMRKKTNKVIRGYKKINPNLENWQLAKRKLGKQWV